ncbi:molybdenum cofactor biosynthesis protein [Rhizophagus clarus]|uniref:Molybdenum cofactor biosynthesis protein n=1 Tax=Rhizophagus clarus TaxID=94130 RepID=A0A8H3LBN4_9GLOM|nr:molybdenum cofactor biosynthesis protein [Rhizophagus clarus]
MSEAQEYSVGILTVSDTASADPTRDLSGPTLKTVFKQASEEKITFNVNKSAIVPDDFEQIQNIVKEWSDNENLDIVVTTGGTGFGVKDITPEAIEPLLQKISPGITYAMITTSLQKTPFAALSRLVSGVRGKTIIMTVPGSPRGAKENLEAVMSVLPHAVDLVRGGTGENVHAQLGVQKESGHQCVHDTKHEHHHDTTRPFLSDPLSGPVTQRQRKSPYPMITVDEALNIIANNTEILGSITVPVNENLVGMVLAEDVYAKEPVPGYRASILDGYAVVASDGPGIYPVVGVSIANAHSEDMQLKPGQIARITTGGPIPNGATAVVMVEDTSLVSASADGLQEESVEIHVQARDNEWIREIGSDTSVGTVIVRKGQLVTAVGGEIGVLSSVGVREVRVYKRPVIGILSTGNEVVNYDEPELKYGQIRDSNRPTFLAIGKVTGFEVKDFGIVSDSAQELENVLKLALSQVDVLVTTGGVSMGEFDLLKPTLERSLEATIHFGRLKMKPGKPTTFATIISDESKKLIFSLPGNPVSATVTFYLFVLPALRKIAGYVDWNLPIVQAELSNNISLDPRPEYHRATISYDYTKEKFLAISTGNQISSRLLSMCSCNALLKLPGKTDQLKELVKVY